MTEPRSTDLAEVLLRSILHVFMLRMCVSFKRGQIWVVNIVDRPYRSHVPFTPSSPKAS